MRDAQVYAGAVVAGAVAGLRSMSAPAFVSRLASGDGAGNTALALLQRPVAVRTTTILALGEAIADKLPFIPNRTSPGPLIARAVSGGLSGAAICSSKKRPAWAGAVLGAAAAVGAAYGAFQLRRTIVRKLRVPDVVVALAEDTVAASGGILILKRLGAV